MSTSAKPKRKLPTTDAGWQTFLQNQKPTGKREEPWTLGQSLFAQMQAAGWIKFYTRQRRRGDAQPKPFALGAFPAVSVAEARKRLSDVRSQIKEGKDPAVEQRRAKSGITKVSTFAELVDAYLARREASGDLAPKTLAIETQALDRMKSAIGDRLLTDVEPHDIFSPIEAEARRLQRKGRTGRLAKIMLAATKRVYQDARDAGLLRGPSPAADLSLKRVVTEKPRDRVLFDGELLVDRLQPDSNEIGNLLAGLRSPLTPVGGDVPTRAALELTLSLGLRAHEVCGIEWSHVRLEDDVPMLVIAQSKTQAGERELPLPPLTVELFRSLKAEAVKPDRPVRKPTPLPKYVFERRDRAGRAEHLHPESLSRAFSRGCAALGIDGATLHDLRRTAISGLGELGYADALIKRIAGHSGGADVTARHYDRSRRFLAMNAALTAWCDVLERALERHEKKQALPMATFPALAAPAMEERS